MFVFGVCLFVVDEVYCVSYYVVVFFVFNFVLMLLDVVEEFVFLVGF